ncbi:hypothetical protein LEP1GSC059_3365 [Leptospira noguchii serovar Panama str. CZ214]|uniref:Uncharacterized protein n=1 Tax=Leptospira noguchii serovar Panama str. CZ214 TaxID=1001595 RepID=T0GV70_9LEPT|nr:hypothetical protein LEP1GSC059_3365 [Leptospira noguchii serovar Panama str. CZ214]
MGSGLYQSIPKMWDPYCLEICNVTKFVGTTANRDFTNQFLNC